MHPRHQPVQGLITVDSTLLPRLEYTILRNAAQDLREAVDPRWVTSVLDIKQILNPDHDAYQFLMVEKKSGFDILVRDQVYYCSQCRNSCMRGSNVTACRVCGHP